MTNGNTNPVANGPQTLDDLADWVAAAVEKDRVSVIKRHVRSRALVALVTATADVVVIPHKGYVR